MKRKLNSFNGVTEMGERSLARGRTFQNLRLEQTAPLR
jgi:hypothetical protein